MVSVCWWPLCSCVVIHVGVYTHTHTPPALIPVTPWSERLRPFSPHPPPRAPGQGASLRSVCPEFLGGLKSIPCNLALNYMPSGHSLVLSVCESSLPNQSRNYLFIPHISVPASHLLGFKREGWTNLEANTAFDQLCCEFFFPRRLWGAGGAFQAPSA